ncbi:MULTISPECIES: hypothetical protein [Herbaspirillum]|uniref:hypothetical protein n=1 Tax=Herbaspirillum TaxID=963 RepID=UPI00067DFF24|nr:MULTISPECIES: hypothetical protein [Herbaspirillum]ASU38909.1 hypothetical protein hmeg3_11855 [Herbaspirillum sp. meg3]
MEFSVPIEPDDEGYLGRECPECEKYFKIKGGTGIPDVPGCHCPYCNHVDGHDTFWTKAQIEYAQSVALHEVSRHLLGEMKKMERRPDRNAFISIGITVKGEPTPIARYSERELEERVTCAACTLQYTIYGAFGYCPDCGVHNSQQIACANFDLSLKLLDLAAGAEANVQAKLVENALEDVVSAFDGFGREHCAGLAYKLSFQNIDAARTKLQKEEGFDIGAGVAQDEWDFVCEQFQKRHLLAHKMGIVDEEFVRKTDSRLPVGRKVPIEEADVRSLVKILKTVVDTLYGGVARR